jgi:signal transduction histidine kinase
MLRTVFNSADDTRLLHSRVFWLAVVLAIAYLSYVVLQSFAAFRWLPTLANWPFSMLAIEASLTLGVVVLSANRFGFKAGLCVLSVMWLIMALHQLRLAENKDTWMMLATVLGFGIATDWTVSLNTRINRDREKLIQAQSLARDKLEIQAMELAEHIKELRCLYRISSLFDAPRSSFDATMEQVPLVVTQSLGGPGDCEARITLWDKVFNSPGWKTSNGAEKFPIDIQGETAGAIEVGPHQDGGRTGNGLLPEERQMCASVSMQLSGFIERMRDEQQLEEYHKHLEQLVEQRTAQLENALEIEKELRGQIEVQMQQRIEFTRAIVHELKTPLTALLAASDLLTDADTVTAKRLALQVNKGALSLNKRINELFDLARGEIGMLKLRCQSTSPARLLAEAFSYFAADAERKGIELLREWPDDLPAMYIDGQRVTQVINNLMQNALKFTPCGGYVKLSARPVATELVFVIEDSGCGIPEDRCATLFEPHSKRADNASVQGGMGIGLAISKMFVDLHGGRIWAQSEAGKGSVFSFALPISNEPSL